MSSRKAHSAVVTGLVESSFNPNTVQRTWDKLSACQPVAEFRHCLHKILTSWKLIPRSLNGIAFNPQPQGRRRGSRHALAVYESKSTPILAYGRGLNKVSTSYHYNLRQHSVQL